MEQKNQITNQADLHQEIRRLKSECSKQEQELKIKLKEFGENLSPVSVIKNSISNLAKDKQVRIDLKKVGLTIGTNFIIDQVFGKYRSFKGFFRSLVAENVSEGIINKKFSKFANVFRLFKEGR